MNIYLTSDHRGVELVNQLYNELTKKYNVIKSKFENNNEDDYPDFAFDVCNRMSKSNDIAILICGNGVGISIAANKVKNVRCARVDNIDDAKAGREHNHANAIALPATLELNKALEIIEVFINTIPSNENRHQRRVNKIISYENGEYNEL